MKKRIRAIALFSIIGPISSVSSAATDNSAPGISEQAVAVEPVVLRYIVQPGDILQISVWKEQDLQAEVVVRPDGGLSFPLAGELLAAGKTVATLREELSQRVKKYVPDAIVTVSVKQPQGNRVYVVGRVNRPGEYISAREIDVMQALSLAGGATPFASLNHIKVLRRTADGQKAIPFRYEDVEAGHDLEQNIVLQGGDVVVVP